MYQRSIKLKQTNIKTEKLNLKHWRIRKCHIEKKKDTKPQNHHRQ
uniref:Uncharacterized protein n=1 Tax=Rhizophora mucronata TaxID=61149 RepID=A0A2P2K992_RHIMU